MEALTADYSFLTSELASLYGLPAPEGQFEMVKFPEGARRAGLLGQGTFLASTAGPTDTSPTARGIFIRERLLCQHVPPPPPGVITTLPDPLAEQPPKGRRQLMDEHVENPTCASCHRLMDPIGFGFEHFDAIGRWRDQEMIPMPRPAAAAVGGRGGPPPIPVEINAQGEIAGLPNSNFTDAKQLGDHPGGQPRVPEMHRPADVPLRLRAAGNVGRREDDRSTCSPSSRGPDSSFKSLLIALVQSPEFLREWNSRVGSSGPLGGSEWAQQTDVPQRHQHDRRGGPGWASAARGHVQHERHGLRGRGAGKTAGIDKRFLVWWNGNGIPGALLDSRARPAKNYELTACLSPLGRVRDYVHVLSGVDNVAARLNGQGNGHFSALCGLMTGTAYTGRGASGPSIDQILAAKIGTKSRFRSLQIGVAQESHGENVHRNMTWAGYERALPQEHIPQNLFDRLFGVKDEGWVNRKKSVLDLVTEDVNSAAADRSAPPTGSVSISI